MRYLFQAIRGWAFGLCATALLAGCGDGSERFFIVQNQVPDESCVVPGERGHLYRGSGTLDVGLVSAGAQTGYRLYPLLQNDLPALGQAGGTEPNRLTLREFRVRLALARPADAPAALGYLFESPGLAPYLEYSQPWSGSLDPGGGTLAAGVTVVPAEVARQIDATGVLDTLSSVLLEARVRAVGATLDDTFESREFLYPIYACKYCLVSRVDPCPYVPANTGACNVAQDESVDCCSDGDSLICPARAPETTTTPTATPAAQ